MRSKENEKLKKKYFNAFKTLVRDHLGNSENWSQLELVAYENRLSY